MSIARTRRTLYRSARVLGDVQAVRRGRVSQRLVNRGLGRLVGRLLSRLWK